MCREKSEMCLSTSSVIWGGGGALEMVEFFLVKFGTMLTLLGGWGVTPLFFTGMMSWGINCKSNQNQDPFLDWYIYIYILGGGGGGWVFNPVRGGGLVAFYFLF